MNRRPAHLIAEAAEPTADGWRRLVDFLASDPEAFGAWCRHDSRARPAGALRARRRQAGTLHEDVPRQERDARLDGLLADMASASAAKRAILVGEALTLHPPAAERRAFRKSAVRKLYRVYYDGLPVREASRLICEDLAHRTGESIRSTGNPGKDQLCDRIVLTGLPTSAETIRQIL